MFHEAHRCPSFVWLKVQTDIIGCTIGCGRRGRRHKNSMAGFGSRDSGFGQGKRPIRRLRRLPGGERLRRMPPWQGEPAAGHGTSRTRARVARPHAKTQSRKTLLALVTWRLGVRLPLSTSTTRVLRRGCNDLSVRGPRPEGPFSWSHENGRARKFGGGHTILIFKGHGP